MCTNVQPQICVQIGSGLRGKLLEHGVCRLHGGVGKGVVPLDVQRAHREIRITARIQSVSWTVDAQQT